MKFHLILLLSLPIFSAYFANCKESDGYVKSEMSGIYGQDVTLSFTYAKDLFPADFEYVYFWMKGTKLLCANSLCTSSKYGQDHVEEAWMFKLEIKNLSLEDEGNYSCSIMIVPQDQDGATFTALIDLEIYKTPMASAVIKTKPKENEVTSAATCYANGGKPLPEIWFEDDSGQKVTTQAEMEYTQDEKTGLYAASLDLKRLFTRNQNGKKYTCVVKHKSLEDTDVGLSTTLDPIEVYYAPDISIREVEATAVNDQFYIAQEKTDFFADCAVDANPDPKYTTWTFYPDNENTNYTLPAGRSLPENFRQEGTHLISESLVIAGNALSNNGTFICKTDNGISTNQASFQLGVYVTPTTTPAPTTPAKIEVTTTTIHSADITFGMEPRQGGSDAAIIGGIVAVVCFVAVVFLILIVRYFCSHKATYHTNEAKETNDFEAIPHTKDEKVELESEISETNEELLLQDKRRPEYFM